MTDASHGQVVASAAEVYDEVFVPALFAQWADQVLDAAGVGAGDAVLDVGCGTGVVARAAAGRVGPHGTVVGLDRNEGMLAVAARAPEPGTWRQGVAEALPFEDATFDRVVCQFAVMFFEDRQAALREMARVLRPGGTLAVASWARLEENTGYAALVQLLRDVVGDVAGDALLPPFCVGTADALAGVVGEVFPGVTVGRRVGTARFDSIEAWLRADARGWILAELIDDPTYARLVDVARRELAGFADEEGKVSFAAPALIATATR
jgi:SAM-dependent methyltransferase